MVVFSSCLEGPSADGCDSLDNNMGVDVCLVVVE